MESATVPTPTAPAATVVPKPADSRAARMLRFAGRTPVNIGLALIAVLWLVPTLGLLFTSLLPVGDIAEKGWWKVVSQPKLATFENYNQLFQNNDLTKALLTTATIAVGNTVLLVLVAALAGYAPATAVQSGPFSGSASLGPAELEITVDPGQVGSNQVHLYLFDATSGAQFSRIKELEVTAIEPENSIGPLPLEPQHSGPGHYTVQGALLNVAGDWDLEVTMRVSAFDEYAAKVEVPIR